MLNCMLLSPQWLVVLTKCNTAVTDFPVQCHGVGWHLRKWWLLPFFLMVWVYPLGFLLHHFRRQSWSIYTLVLVGENNQVLWFYT